MQSFFKFLSKLNFILLASALLYSTSFNSHQISWLGASFVSVLRRACTWVYKQANFSQIGQYHHSSCIDNSSFSPVFTSPPPAALVLASLRRSCFSWKPMASRLKICPGGPMPSRLPVCPGGPIPSRLRICPGGFMPSQLKFFPGGPMPSQLKFALEDPCPVD